MHLLSASPNIYFGRHSLDALRTLPEGHIMLVCDPFLVQSGILRKATDRLDACKRTYTVFSDVQPDPSIETATAGMQVLFAQKPDILVALGGGSAIDTAKAILYFCLKYKSSLMGKQYIHKPFFVAVPTTSGTGSEVTSYTVLTDKQNNCKIPLSDNCMIPDAAILDPAFTKTLPKEMIAYTGMDVLTHATEAYVARQANSFTDTYAVRAAATALRCLPLLYGGDQSTETHQEMMVASTMAGLAFNNAGLGLCHGIAHTIGAEYHLPHGKANSIVLPWVIAFNAGLGKCADPARQTIPGRYAALARHLGCGPGGDVPVAEELVQLVQNLNKLFGIVPGLAESGAEEKVFEERVPEMTDKILEDMTTQANPVPVSRGDIETLLKEIYAGGSPI